MSSSDHRTPRSPGRARSARSRAGRALLKLGSTVKRFLIKRLVTGEPTAPSDPPLEEISRRYPVVAYFAETPVRGYQLVQWLPVLERLAVAHPVVIATRSWTMTGKVRELSDLPVVYCRTLDSLMAFYNRIDAKVVLYPNNGVRNFQSLIYRRGLHVHINHGESDKVSMVSNQAKAYDTVVIAGEAARERHRRALVNFDVDTLVACGRPQLDLEVPGVLTAEPGRRTILYAPTWWGENDANNYTSLDLYGLKIVGAALATPDVRLVYRPHPRVAAAPPGPIADAHRAILGAITTANSVLGRQVHLHLPDGDILGLFDGTDLLITDVSSVGLDFLYRRSDAPIILTDRRNDRDLLAREAPISTATDVIDGGTIGQAGAIIAANLDSDPRLERRNQIRDHYFGFERGDSTRRFFELISTSIVRRDEMIARLDPADARLELENRGEDVVRDG